MTKEEILDYVMNSPENTNRMVLNDMLNQLQSGGGWLTVVFSTTDMENFTADKTCAEVMSAYNSLVPVYGYIELPDGGYVTIAVKNVYAEYIVFGKITIVTGRNELAEMTLVLHNDESVTYRDDAYMLTPIT